LALSPDAASVAVGRVAVGNRDIWLAEFARGANTRLTSDPGQDGFPVWSPDGRTVVFTSNRNGPADLFQKSAAGSGEDEVLLKSSEQKYPQDWSRDGRFLLYTTQNGQIGGATAPGAKAGSDLWVLPMKGPEGAQGSDARKPVLFLAKSANATQAKFSPDGHWIVYNSNESGRPEVYVRPFPPSSNGGGQSVVSTGGGYQPLWRRDGKEILYLAPDNRVMSVDVSVAPAFKPGIAKPLFVVPITGGANITTAGHYWDVSSDGQRFLINATLEDAGSPPITVVMNWTTGMKK
jgi:Tol biopolymer transport system component